MAEIHPLSLLGVPPTNKHIKKNTHCANSHNIYAEDLVHIQAGPLLPAPDCVHVRALLSRFGYPPFPQTPSIFPSPLPQGSQALRGGR